MAHSFHNLVVHVIFGTKDRYPFIDSSLAPRLHAYLGGIVREIGADAIVVGGAAEHVHLLVKLPATLCVADAVRLIKTNSSKWVHETQPKPAKFAWQSGYSAFSVSQSGVDDVRAYIARQEDHHRRVTFQEEYVAFLQKHGIEYDERYVWE